MASSAGEAFWTWVLVNEPRLRAAIEAKTGAQDVLDELVEQLHAVDPDLYVLMGGQPDGPIELIVTAEGKLTAFPAVASLVNEAPPLEGWQVIAFKPPMGCEFVLNHEGARIDVSETHFLALSSLSGSFGVRLGCATYDPNLDQAYRFAAFQVLDALLGELVAARDVQHVEIDALPVSHEEDGYLPLAELPDYLAWRSGRTPN